MTYTILLALMAALLGCAVGYLYARSARTAHDAAREAKAQEERTALIAARDVLQSRLTALQQQADGQSRLAAEQLAAAKAEAERQLAEAKDTAARQLAEAKAEAERQRREAEAQHERRMQQQHESDERQRTEMESHYRQQLADFRAQQKTQMEQQSNLIREQINSASEEILKKRQDELSSTNKEQLAAILNPLHEHIRQMREAVEKSDREQTTTMERLDASIKANLKQAQEVGERADKLAQALTSENKAQGNFGELRLRTLLESMGLEEGVQFEEQVTLRDERGNAIHDEEQGRRMVPDVVLHFPDNRDVVIDSKMSLKAFEDYFNDSDAPDLQRQDLQRHVASVRQHVRELAHKNYSSYIRKGNNKLDFVVMYIYSESALQLALTADPGLWREAYDAGVVISGSQNLYMMLRVLEMTWRQVRQAENQDKIMETARELVNRVQLFYERFLAADDQLGKAQKAFAALRNSVAPTGKSIITSANQLVKYGAPENPKRKHKLPKAGEDDSPGAPEGEDAPQP